MRILRLDLGLNLGTVDLHPFVSIIHGLNGPQRSALTEAVRALANGSEPPPAGLVEADGRLLELPDAGVAGLGPFTTEDVVVALDGGKISPVDLPGCIAELDQVMRKAQIDAVYVEEVRADLRPSALAELQVVKDKLAGANAVNPQIEEAEATIEKLEGAMNKIAAIDPIIRESRDEVTPAVEKWEAYQAAKSEAAEHLGSLENLIKAAESTLAQAIARQAEVEKIAVPVLLSRADDDRLEELLGDAMGSGKRSKKHSAEDDAEADALLAKVGQSTYAGYLMYRVSPQLTTEHIEMKKQAASAVDQARNRTEEARTALEMDPVAYGLTAEHEAVKAEARIHLGPMLPDDLGKAMSALVNERDNPDWLDALDVLGDLLIMLNVDVPIVHELAPEGLIEMAQQMAQESKQEIADIEAKLAPEDLDAALVKAEARFKRHVRAMARIDRMEATASGSSARVEELQAMIAGAGSNAPQSGVKDLGLRIAGLAERIRAEAGAPAPLLMLGEFDGLDSSEIKGLMSELEPLARDIQLIFVSDNSAAASWARDAGLRRALNGTTSVAAS